MRRMFIVTLVFWVQGRAGPQVFISGHGGCAQSLAKRDASLVELQQAGHGAGKAGGTVTA